MSVTDAGRQAAESLMTLTLTAYSPAGTTTDADGFKVQAYADEGTTFGYVPRKKPAPTTRYIRVGNVERPVLAGGLHIPIGAKVPQVGEQVGQAWEYEITAVGPLDNPALTGVRFLAVAIDFGALTACRLDVVEV